MIHRVKQSEVVPFSPVQMFKLVADIDHYRDFLPWCTGSKVLDRKNGEVLAEIQLAYGPIETAFTTSNENHPNSHIDLHLVHGPLRQLEGKWYFEDMSHGSTRVSLELRFELSHMVLGVLLGEILSEIAGVLLISFKQRARALYGRRQRRGRKVHSTSPRSDKNSRPSANPGLRISASKRKTIRDG
jgi:ribosome-associated toxin RatA of RatAB toxin-antitoxin module